MRSKNIAEDEEMEDHPESIYKPMGESSSSAESNSKPINEGSGESHSSGHRRKQLSSFMTEVLEIKYSDLTFMHQIGSGALGAVWLGKWRGSSVAIKMLKEVSEESLADLRREADTISRLRPHGNVVQFLGITISPEVCIVTEFLEGGSLFTLLKSGKTILDAKTLKRFTKGVCAGMLHLHSEGIIHRDLAARNVLLSKDSVKITDFGLSRIVEAPTAENKTYSNTGPLRWMSPESLRHKVYNTKTDVWSFGVLLVEILTRDVPYVGYTAVQVGALVVLEKGYLVLQPPSFTPPIMSQLVRQCMQRNPELV